MSKIVDPIYESLCPGCNGDVKSSDLESFGICSSCLSRIRNRYVLSAYTLHESNTYEIEKFKEFFRQATNGLTPWGPQITWIKRLINNENTALIAPTGMGKTTLLLTYALYMNSEYRKRILILSPTRSLAKQIYNKLLEYSERLTSKPEILIYDSSMTRKKRDKILERIKNNEYDILIGTNHFFIKYFNTIFKNNIDILIIDDVDSIMRSSKNIVKLLKILGYDEKIIELTKKRINLLWKIIVSKSVNNDELMKKLIHELISIENQLSYERMRKKYKQVVIASATGRTRGLYGKVLRSILRMDLSGITIYGRDITDTYISIGDDDIDEATQKIVNIVSRMGSGGIILISPRHPYKDKLRKILNNLVERLRSRNVFIEEADPKSIKRFTSGEIDLIYGSSSYYGVSVRGIDAPEVIKYIIFLGVPVFTIELKTFLTSPKTIMRMLMLLKEITKDRKYIERLNIFRRKIFTLSSSELRIISMVLKEKIRDEDLNDKLKEIIDYVREEYNNVLKEAKEILNEREVVEMGTITLLRKGGKYLAVVPDTMTYIQASGRTSRLYLGRMTHGLSVIVEFEKLYNLVNSLRRRLQSISATIDIVSLDYIDLGKEIVKLRESRKAISETKPVNGLKYKNILVVVESPTKAKTIARFFGKPVRRNIDNISIYEIPFTMEDEIIHLNIVASRGHLFDLTTDPNVGSFGVIISDNSIHPVYSTIKRCRICGYQFTYGDKCPRCGSSSYTDSRSIVSVLRKLAEEADEVYIATDPDIEGEKIAYDIYLAIKAFNRNIWRIELHEITPTEFLKALRNPRRINKRLVHAEIYRRVMDRIIGFSLSQYLWGRFSKYWLGAGRVQTPVLGWIIDRYEKYNSSKCKLIIYTLENDLLIKKCIPRGERELLDKLKNASKAIIVIDEIYTKNVNPPPPFTTDELLYVAGLYGIPSKTTMKIAQELFESGLITYHRTDHHYISNTGIKVAEKYLSGKNMLEYFKPSHWGDRGAHEAIRPIHPYDREDLEKAIVEGLINPVIPLTWLHYRVYDLIFKRFIASQMKPYKVEIAKLHVFVDNIDLGVYEYPVKIVEDGFNLVERVKTAKIDTNNERMEYTIKNVKIINSSTIKLHNESTIVKEMKREGLGRPSTYATIISSIIRHGYAIRSKKRGYLIPTKTGIEVYNTLNSEFPDLVSVETTRAMENNIDRITRGEISSFEALFELIESIRRYNLPLSVSISWSYEKKTGEASV